METMSGLDGLGWPNPKDEPKPTKSMSDTQETDGEWNRISCYDHPQFEQGIAEFARKLERERDEARERIKNNPWCEACSEPDCCVSGDGTCAMIRKYLLAKSVDAKLATVTEQVVHHRRTLLKNLGAALCQMMTEDWRNENERNTLGMAGHWLEKLGNDDQLDQTILRLGETQERMIDAERQRDNLAEALKLVAEGSLCCACRGSAELVSIAEAALQSLTP